MDAQLFGMIIWGAVIVVFAVTLWVRVLVAEARASRKAVGWKRNRTRLRCLDVLQIILAVVMFRVWFFVGNWWAARTPSDVKETFGITVPERWRAVVISGGVYSEWPQGTVRDNPGGFALWAGLLVIIMIALPLSAAYAGRLRRQDSAEQPTAPSERPDT